MTDTKAQAEAIARTLATAISDLKSLGFEVQVGCMTLWAHNFELVPLMPGIAERNEKIYPASPEWPWPRPRPQKRQRRPRK